MARSVGQDAAPLVGRYSRRLRSLPGCWGSVRVTAISTWPAFVRTPRASLDGRRPTAKRDVREARGTESAPARLGTAVS